MAQVVLENVYKSFVSRKGERVSVSATAEPLLTLANQELPTTRPSSQQSHNVSVLRRINLTVQDGEFMVLVGPSGCGKSTLLRLIAGLEELTGGNIWVGDRLVNDLPPKERDIAMVFQSYALYPHMTVYDNLAFGLRRTRLADGSPGQKRVEEPLPLWSQNLLVALSRNLPKGLRYISHRERIVDERVRNVAQMLQIEPLLNRLPKQLSGGQKQRVALGRAMARNPQVFLMDEPLSNLDAKLRAETRAQIVKLQRQLEITTIYVTHDQTEAMTMGDRIAVMNAGQIQQIAAPLELYNHPANQFVAEFIGSPPMNFLKVQVQAPLRLVHPQFRLTLPEVWSTTLQNYDGRSVTLGIRPEHFYLARLESNTEVDKFEPNGALPQEKSIPVEVERVEALGNETYLAVNLMSQASSSITSTLQVRIRPDEGVRVGDRIRLAILTDQIHLFDTETGLALARQ